jgi:DNA-binding NarL/FixJ family response regulator
MENPQISEIKGVETEINSVLLAENDLEQCFFFKKSLLQVRRKIQYTEVHDGEALMKLLRNFMPDILFIDLGMPCKNGMDCIRELRKNRAYDTLPIVVYSINTHPDIIHAAYVSGANLYLVKPSEYYNLVHSLDTILSMDWSDPEKVKLNFLRNDRFEPFKR